MTVIRSADKIKFDATSTVEVQDTSLRLANLTTTQRNALTASNGDMIYNSTINQFEVYENGTWRSLASDQDVTDEVAALVDSAPSTLDTLNELAAALGDDPNFATTTTNSIATKLPLAGGTMSGDIDGNGNKVLFANVYSSTSDLPSASTYHGMFAHVHGTGKGYFAHAGAWIELANQSDLTTTTNSIAGKEPTITAGTATQYYRGDKSFQTLDTLAVAENTNLYYTDARADARIANNIIDEDNMATDSATRAPSQQSVKAYVDANSGGGGLGSVIAFGAISGGQGSTSTTRDFSMPIVVAPGQTVAGWSSYETAPAIAWRDNYQGSPTVLGTTTYTNSTGSNVTVYARANTTNSNVVGAHYMLFG